MLCLPAEKKEKYPTVVLAHGFGGNYHYLTGRIAEELAKNGYAAYAFNFRNPDTRSMLGTSPLTEAKTLDIVLDELQKQPWVDTSALFLLGESQGGFVAAYTAAQRPEDIAGLILFYPAFVLQDEAKTRNPSWSEANYTFLETEIIGGNEVSGMYSRDALSFDIYEIIGSYNKDVLIVHGTNDPVVPLAYSERAAETYENAELKIIDGAGHGFYGGKPFTVSVGYVIEYLKECSQDTSSISTVKPMNRSTSSPPDSHKPRA